MKKMLAGAVASLVLVAAAFAAFLYSGLYNIAAGEPHWPITERVIALVRTRSIEVRARDLAVPNLADPKRMLTGAGQYAEMCESCHLAPGVADTPLRQGLYPKPPELARHRMDARTSFWIIKHGIKMTGMPAWGMSHDDDVLWRVVAFLQKLPELDANQYREMVAKAPRDEEMKAKPDEKGSPTSAPERGPHSGMPMK